MFSTVNYHAYVMEVGRAKNNHTCIVNVANSLGNDIGLEGLAQYIKRCQSVPRAHFCMSWSVVCVP
jgi:hypothetical protein